jgi:predicted RNA-binding Zn-ribbon protein involved in translation (DUF1610 family)
MINRRRLECISCETRIVTRTGIGHGTVQKHKFACPKCGIEIGFVLHLDQQAVTFEYDDPKNARWIDGDDDGTTILFYPEVMVPKDLPYPFSPFVATFGSFKDIQDYQRAEAARRHIKDEVWPVLQRVYVHFENRNIELLKKDATAIVNELPDLTDDENRAGWLMSVTRHYFDFFVADPKGPDDLGKVAARAVLRNEPALLDLGSKYVASGRMAALWKELKSVRRQFMELYESLLPLLMVRRYWRDDEQDVTRYDLSVKNFEDLKGFYIDCVETSFRLLVVGLAIALIEQTGVPIIKTQKGDKDIWWFEQMNNGIRNGQLDKYPVFSPITQVLDLGLRNGVGHHSAHYEVGTDEIVYVKADDASLSEIRLPYTCFVDKVFGAYCGFEAATVFFHFLFVGARGEL